MRRYQEQFRVFTVVCLTLLLSHSFATGEEPTPTEESKPVTATAENAESIAERLRKPISLELKAGTTISEALQQLADAAGVKIEHESPILGASLNSESAQSDLAYKLDMTLDADNFQTALDELGAAFVAADGDERDLSNFLLSRFIAVPLDNKVLLGNEYARIGFTCPMVTEVYDIQDFVVTESFIAPPVDLLNLIREHVVAYWTISGVNDSELSGILMPFSGPDFDKNIEVGQHPLVCKMNFMGSQNLLVVKAPRSVHYQINQLLAMLREAEANRKMQRQETMVEAE